MKQVKRLLYAVSSSVLFLSCNIATDVKLSDYLEYSVLGLFVVDKTFSCESKTDEDSVLCIPSYDDCTIRYLIQNPKAYEITASVTTAADSVAAGITDAYSSKVSDSSDVVELSLSRDLLRALEGGGTLDPTIAISCEDYSGTIDPFSDSLRVNSAPPRVEGACVMINSSEAISRSKGSYVLCFNLPESILDADGIHTDIEKIRIEGLVSGKSALYSSGIEMDINLTNKTYDTSYLSSTAPGILIANPYNNNTENGNLAVTFAKGTYPVYVSDLLFASASSVVSYKITLIDQKGLETSVSVKSDYMRLGSISSNTATGSSVVTTAPEDDDDDETVETPVYTLTLTAPTKLIGYYTTNDGSASGSVSGVDVYYEIYTVSNNAKTFFCSGRGTNSVSKDLEAGSYYVRTYAIKDGYVDSAIKEISFTVADQS